MAGNFAAKNFFRDHVTMSRDNATNIFFESVRDENKNSFLKMFSIKQIEEAISTIRPKVPLARFRDEVQSRLAAPITLVFQVLNEVFQVDKSELEKLDNMLMNEAAKLRLADLDTRSLPFGKHKGQSFAQIYTENPSYFKFLLNTFTNLRDDTRQLIIEYLGLKDSDMLAKINEIGEKQRMSKKRKEMEPESTPSEAELVAAVEDCAC